MVLPEDSGPKISTMRPRGRPPTPRAMSRENEPVGIEATSTLWVSPSVIMAPSPNLVRILARSSLMSPGSLATSFTLVLADSEEPPLVSFLVMLSF